MSSEISFYFHTKGTPLPLSSDLSSFLPPLPSFPPNVQLLPHPRFTFFPPSPAFPLPLPIVTPPSSFRSSSVLSPTPGGGGGGDPTRASTSSSRPLSILSTFSSHRREPAGDTNSACFSPPSSTPSPSGRRKDSRGLQAAKTSKNFEDELNSGETRHLKSDSVGSAASSFKTTSRRGSARDPDDYNEDDGIYDDGEEGSYLREQEILIEEDEPLSPRHQPPQPTRTTSSTSTVQPQPSTPSTSSTLDTPTSSTDRDARSRTSSAETASSLTPKPPQLPTFPSASSSIYSTTSSLAPATPGVIPQPPLVVPPTPTSVSTSTSSISHSSFGGAKKIRQTSAGSTSTSPSSVNGTRGAGVSVPSSPGGSDSGEKRRSLFRVGGTASSPDLATLVRKKKEARAAQGGTLGPTTPSPAANESSDPFFDDPPPPPTPEKDLPSSSSHGDWAGGRLEDMDEKKVRRNSGEEQQEILGDEWDTRFDGARDEGMHLPGVRAIGLGFGNIEKEGFNKSMRNKAKNVFSKMFSAPSPSRPPPRASPSATSLRFHPSISSSSLAPSPYGQHQDPPSRTPSSSRRPSVAAPSSPPRPPHVIPPLGPPVSPFMKGSPSPPTLHERRLTDPTKKANLTPIGSGSPQKSSSGHLLPGGGRRRSLSVGGMGGTMGWEVDVEGALDGIVQRTPPTSPTRIEMDGQQGSSTRMIGEISRNGSNGGGRLSPMTDDDGPFGASSSNRRTQDYAGPASPVFSRRDGPSVPNPHAISSTTTITSGRGPAKRVVIGKRKLSNPVVPTLSSTSSSAQPPTPPPKPRVSTSSSYISTSSPTAASIRRSPTPSGSSSPAPPKPSVRTSSLQSSAINNRSSSSVVASSTSAVTTPPTSPVRGHFPVQPPVSSHSGRSSASTPTNNAFLSSSSHARHLLDEEEDDNSSKNTTPTAPSTARFQEQTIRLVPASPSNRTPTLPNNTTTHTPLAGESPPLPPLPPPNPTFTHTAPDDDADGTVAVGLGILGASVGVEDRPLEGETDEEKGKDAARRILEEDQTFKWVRENRVCEFLGGVSAIQHAAVTAYMASYDFKGLKLEMAVRRLTSKLYFKAESQELDRVIGALAVRFWDCNPSGLYGSSDVVHQLVYALLLLNTDLHVVDQDKKMSRDGFVENTMGSIRMWASTQQQQQQAQAPSPSPNATTESINEDSASSIRGADVFHDANGGVTPPTAAASSSAVVVDSSASSTIGKTSKRGRSGSIASSLREKIAAHGSTPALVSSQVASVASASASSVMINTPNGSSGDPRPSIGRFGSSSTSLGSSFVLTKSWVYEMESLLKDMYTAVKSQRILQPVGEVVSAPHLDKPHSFNSNSLHSSPGSLSRGMSLRSYSSNTMNSKRNSMRSLAFLSDTIGSRSRIPTGSSTFSGSGRASPTPSHATSLGEGLHDFNNPFGSNTTAMGFAHNLSRTIIKEQDDESLLSTDSKTTDDELSDEVMALEGPPWAKEGMVTRRIAFTEDKKKSRDKTWKPLFAVAQGGTLSTFTFGEGSSSRGGGSGGVVGGGNWTSNAQAHHQINLVHAFACTVPKPGYNRSRPYVFSVKECTGALTYFEVGTETINEEWVLTCNYWAARLSQPPLVGGVSNMDYGWGRPVYPGDDDDDNGKSSVSRQRTISSGAGGGGGGSGAFINEWNPPFQGNSESKLQEQPQLDALIEYKRKLEKELVEFRPMERFLAHGQRARDNYSRKLVFLEGQVLKYSVYVKCLGDAVSARYKKKGENKEARDLKRADKVATSSGSAAPSFATAPSLRSIEDAEEEEEQIQMERERRGSEVSKT